MWIENTNQQTRRLFNDELMDEAVAFSESGTAQVAEDVGEALCEHYDTIQPYSAEDDEL